MEKCYSTDLSDDEWECLQLHVPAPNKRGRPRTHSTREILNAIFYVLKSGCPWRLLPKPVPEEVAKRWAREWAKEGKKVDWQGLMAPRGYVALPRRWVVERTFSWLDHNRRMSKDYERLCASTEKRSSTQP
jgi:transposase